jgi:uncharacterized protein YwqG
MQHSQIDFSFYERIYYPFEIDYRQIYVDMTSPWHLIHNETVKWNYGITSDNFSSLETDIFLFSIQPSSNRTLTKIGGIPYRKRDLEWPTHPSNNQPMKFIGQINFMDSKDICKKLPGDILLIFAFVDECGIEFWEVKHPLLFEWVTVSDHPLIDVLNIPNIETEFEFIEHSGHIYRTRDFYIPEFDCEDLTSAHELLRNSWAEVDFLFDEQGFCANSATKIGGLPDWIQGKETIPGYDYFLCQIPTFCTNWNKPYPCIDHPEPIIFTQEQLITPGFEWPGSGCLYLFMNNKGEVDYIFQAT